MKRLVVINGVPGVGKTTVCRLLNQRLQQSVWLDGDWCWMINPFLVTEENKRMVEGNIVHLLQSFLDNSSLHTVIFSWVIHREEILDSILGRLQGVSYTLTRITLLCSEEALRDRMMVDGRTEDQIKRSISRLGACQDVNTAKINTTALAPEETVARVIALIDSF